MQRLNMLNVLNTYQGILKDAGPSADSLILSVIL